MTGKVITCRTQTKSNRGKKKFNYKKTLNHTHSVGYSVNSYLQMFHGKNTQKKKILKC